MTAAMQRILVATLVLPVCLFAQNPINRHILGVSAPLTQASGRPASDIARDFLRAAAPESGLTAADAASAVISRQYTDAHNGVTHIVYRQQFQGVDVYNSAFVVNLDAAGRVLNAGGDLFPAPDGAPLANLTALDAVRAAVRSVNPRAAARYVPFPSQAPARHKSALRFTAGDLPDDPEARPVWFGANGKVVPAWQVFVTGDDGVSRYSVIADANQHILATRPLTFFQAQPPPPRGLVFERESPQPNPKPGTLPASAPPVVERTLQSFAGDPIASPKGWVENNETAGNNAIVGEDRLGLRPFGQTVPFPQLVTTKAPNGDFSFPLELGPGAPNPLQFIDAINTNLFYWINRAHDLHYASGFTEAAGNFQNDNFGRGGIGGDRIQAFTHFGAANPTRALERNAFFSEADDADGSQAFIAMYISDSGINGILTDGALDSQVIVHEYTHGVSSRLLPRGYDSFQVAAMGEAWSDFYAMEYLTPEGAPTNGVYPATEYFFQSWTQDAVRTRPYSTDFDINPLTFADLGSVIPYQEVHADGEIWVEALWEARANLIQQFGEKEGRRRIRMLVLDGMKLAPPRSTMVDMRDAILLADRNNFKGASQDQLWAAFAKRGLGALAYSDNPDTTHVLPSFAVPTAKAQIGFYDSVIPFGDQARIVVSDPNYTGSALRIQLVSNSGDIETVSLHKQGSIYVGSVFTSSNVVNRENGTVNVMTGDYIAAFYNDAAAPGGPTQIYTSAAVQLPYFETIASSTAYTFDNNNERQVFATGIAAKVDLPFDFPFFSAKYRTMFVHENGLITFGSGVNQTAVTSGCTDSNSLASINGIAPLWLDMTTLGGSQDSEGVFVTRNIVDQVTVRWPEKRCRPSACPAVP